MSERQENAELLFPNVVKYKKIRIIELILLKMLSQSIQFMKVSFLIFIIQKYHKTDKEWSYVLYTVFITTLPLVLPCDASFTVVQGAL